MTEQLYVQYWHRRYRERVLVTIGDFHGGPRELVDRAVEAKREAERAERRGRGSAYDEVWCIFDVDAHEKLHEAVDRAGPHSIHLAISNPCIELWFVLHFQDQTAYIERGPAQSKSKELLGCDKALSRAALEELGERFDEAAKRAQELDKKHEGDGSPPGSNPSTSVWRLIERITEQT